MSKGNLIPYSGAKTRVVNLLGSYFPKSFNEYREPFVGGGSVFCYVKSHPELGVRSYWINDKFEPVYCLYKQVQKNHKQFIERVLLIKNRLDSFDNVVKWLDSVNPVTDQAKALHFYISVMIGFSHNGYMCGYSKLNFKSWLSRADSMYDIEQLLQGVKITCTDYSTLLKDTGDCFIFMDPPYYTASELYGVKGSEFHANFDFDRYVEEVKSCSCKWMITLDDCKQVREWFKDFRIIDYQTDKIFGVKPGGTSQKYNEVMIMNY